MTKVLKYFELNGLAESIRYILLYTGQKFEDIRYDHSTWPIKEIKDALPYGQLPVLEENGEVLHQSLAIARYVAANTELLPSDPWEQAKLDAMVLTVYDFYSVAILYVKEKDPVQKQKYKEKFYNEVLDYYFSKFEKHLKANNGYFGGKLSWADFILVGLTECTNLLMADQVEKQYPAISALIKRIQELPGVREYVRDRKPYVFEH